MLAMGDEDKASIESKCKTSYCSDATMSQEAEQKYSRDHRIVKG